MVVVVVLILKYISEMFVWVIQGKLITHTYLFALRWCVMKVYGRLTLCENGCNRNTLFQFNALIFCSVFDCLSNNLI